MNADACPTETTPVPSVTARRIAANRAELFASAIRRLATDLEAAAQRPTDWRAQGILDADRTEALGACTRFADATMGIEAVRVGGFNFAALNLQGSSIAADAAKPAALRMWADRWDAYAVAIDP